MESSSDEDVPVAPGSSRWQRRRKRLRDAVQFSDDSEEQDSPAQSPAHEAVHGVGSGDDDPHSASSTSEDAAEINSGAEDNGAGDIPQDENVPHEIHDDIIQEDNATDSDEAVEDDQPVYSTSDDDDNIEVEGVNRDFDGSEESDYSVESIPQDEDDELLYVGAPISLRESLMSVLTLSIRHGLTGTCVGDILELISMHCPPDNICVKKLHKYKKYFSMIGNSSLTPHFYCSTCMYPLEHRDSVCGNCEEADQQQETTFFIELPLRSQLQTMLAREGFYDNLQYRFNRVKKSQENIEDIYDGEMYRNFFDENGFLSNPNNISFMWYSDGVAIYNSSNFQIWPLYFIINELSPRKRKLQENVILAGLWFGPKKPNPNIFLQPFYTVLNAFRTEGFELLPAGHPPTVIRGMLLHGVADLPAKSTFLRFKHFNGSYGCCSCECEGERFDLGNATVQVYPYTPNMPLRNNHNIEQYALQAVELRQRNPTASVCGVKGPTLLYRMVPNMVRCTGTDKMHAVDNGVAKQVLHLMFDSSFSNEPFSVRAMIGVVDERLNQIKPPSFVQRMPRSIEHKLAFWKSQVFRDWLMYYSLPVLLGILDEHYFRHHSYLVSAIFILTQRSITNAQVNDASELLHLYVSEFQELYGLRHLGMNIHHLLHLPQAVRDLGPLWVNSCYSFEDLNGRLAKLIHGSRHAGLQVCSAASSYLNLPVMIRELPEGSAARKFCERLTSNVQYVKVTEEITPTVHVIGNFYDPGDAVKNNTRIALTDLGIANGTLKYFHRLRRLGVMYYTSSYPKTIQKESSYVQFFQANVPRLGRITHFLKWSDCGPGCHERCNDCPMQYFAEARVYSRQPWHIHTIPRVRLPYLNKVVATDEIVLFPVDCLQCLCFLMKVENDLYLATPVTDLEGN